MKIRPVSPRGSSTPSSSSTLTVTPNGARPTVPGAARRSAGVATVPEPTSVEA